jgi:hypothetical protein
MDALADPEDGVEAATMMETGAPADATAAEIIGAA